MRYPLTLRTYNTADCTSTGYHIRANRTTVRVASRSRWQGSRERVWFVSCPDGDGLEMAKRMAEWDKQPERAEDGITMEEHWGLAPDAADRVGHPIR